MWSGCRAASGCTSSPRAASTWPKSTSASSGAWAAWWRTAAPRRSSCPSGTRAWTPSCPTASPTCCSSASTSCSTWASPFRYTTSWTSQSIIFTFFIINNFTKPDKNEINNSFGCLSVYDIIFFSFLLDFGALTRPRRKLAKQSPIVSRRSC